MLFLHQFYMPIDFPWLNINKVSKKLCSTHLNLCGAFYWAFWAFKKWINKTSHIDKVINTTERQYVFVNNSSFFKWTLNNSNSFLFLPRPLPCIPPFNEKFRSGAKDPIQNSKLILPCSNRLWVPFLRQTSIKHCWLSEKLQLV